MTDYRIALAPSSVFANPENWGEVEIGFVGRTLARADLSTLSTDGPPLSQRRFDEFMNELLGINPPSPRQRRVRRNVRSTVRYRLR